MSAQLRVKLIIYSSHPEGTPPIQNILISTDSVRNAAKIIYIYVREVIYSLQGVMQGSVIVSTRKTHSN